jgi:hypothetical protein
MATSSSYDFSLNAGQIIAKAMGLIGETASGEPIDSEDQTTCLQTLNMMIKFWQAEEIYLWKYVEASLFLQRMSISTI